jgi:hypothetical protein
MAALEQDRLRAAFAQCGAGAMHRRHIADRFAEQQFRFRQVRRDDRGHRQQPRPQRIQCVVREQLGTGRRHHHRIEHDGHGAMRREQSGDGVDHACRRQHAELHRAHVEIVEARIDLRPQERHVGHVHRRHAARVLRGERGNRRQAVHAVRGEGLQVRLDAAPPPESEPAIVNALGVIRGLRAGSARWRYAV